MRKQGDVRAWVRNNAVTVMFVLLCIICIIYSGQSMSYVIYEMFGRLSRNAFIVLALIPQPELVFLDELTTGLDAKARRDVWKRLADLKDKGLTIFLTSHFMDEVEALCDEICILKKGKIVFQGTIQQAKLQCNCGKFEDAYLMLSGEEETEQ